MAHLWVDTGAEWAIAQLEGNAFVLTGDADLPLRRRREEDAGQARVLLLRAGGGQHDGPAWALMSGRAGPEVHVNGSPLDLGARLLQDRDSIRVGRVHMYYSAETLPRAETYPQDAPEVACARCRQPMQPGHAAVRCPSCELWHHESEDLRCWTYEARCAQCDQPTALDAGWRWTPEDL